MDKLDAINFMLALYVTYNKLEEYDDDGHKRKAIQEIIDDIIGVSSNENRSFN